MTAKAKLVRIEFEIDINRSAAPDWEGRCTFSIVKVHSSSFEESMTWFNPFPFSSKRYYAQSSMYRFPGAPSLSRPSQRAPQQFPRSCAATPSDSNRTEPRFFH